MGVCVRVRGESFDVRRPFFLPFFSCRKRFSQKRTSEDEKSLWGLFLAGWDNLNYFVFIYFTCVRSTTVVLSHDDDKKETWEPLAQDGSHAAAVTIRRELESLRRLERAFEWIPVQAIET